MTWTVSLWLQTFAIGVAALGLLLLALVLLSRATPTRAARFYCPRARRTVAVQFLADRTAHPVGVVSCSAFPDPSVISCGLPCLASAASRLGDDRREVAGLLDG